MSVAAGFSHEAPLSSTVLRCAAAGVLFGALGAVSAGAAAGDETLAKAETALDQAWEGCPFSLGAAILVSGPTEGYGLFEPRPSNVFGADEPIYLYLEPECFGYERVGDRYRFGMSADFTVFDAADSVVFVRQDFAEFTFESFHRNKEIKVDVNYELSGAPPGAYVIETVLHDKAGKGKASVRTKVVFK